MVNHSSRFWVCSTCQQDCITQTKADIDASFIPGPLVGHCGDGNFHVFLLVNTSSEREMAEATRLNKRMVERYIILTYYYPC
jgi:D-lactate dehydrogenase (cytochrome)